MIVKRKKERTDREMSTTTINTLIRLYVEDMELKNRTTDSKVTNQRTLARFARHLGSDGEVAIKSLTIEKARDYVRWLQSRTSKWDQHPNRPTVEKPLSPYTIRKTVKVMRGFGAWMYREGFSNPFEDLEIPTVPKDLVEVLSPEEVQKIFEAMNPNAGHGSRDMAMVHMMLDSGLRISEVANLRLQHLDLQNREARFMGKGRKERIVPFGKKTAKLLIRYIEVFRPKPSLDGEENNTVFLTVDGYPMTRNSMESIMRRLKHTSGVKKFHAHLLRHTFAVNFMTGGENGQEGDLETLRRILGHESIEVTKRYLSGLNAKQVRRAYESRSPMDRMEVDYNPRRFRRQGAAARRRAGADDQPT